MLDKKTILLREFLKSQVIIIWVNLRMRYNFKSRCQRASEKTTLTCFSESLEGARMSGQLEDPDDSEHFDYPDQSDCEDYVESGSLWKSLGERMISYLKNCAILRTWHNIHQKITRNADFDDVLLSLSVLNFHFLCYLLIYWLCFTFTVYVTSLSVDDVSLSLSMLPPDLLIMFYFHFLRYLLICW